MVDHKWGSSSGWDSGVIFLFLFFLFAASTDVQAQESIHISGKVLNNIDQKGIKDVSLQVAPVKGTDSTNIGVTTGREGKFELYFNYRVPFKLRITHVSFHTRELTIRTKDSSDLTIELVPRVVKGEDVVVTARLISEEELKNPVTVDKVSTVDIKQLASFSSYDLISTLREVDVATQSMTMQSVNTRGFNASANKRFLQLTDGIDNQAPGLSFPIGNLMAPSGLDIASLEVLPGPSSAKYGSSALNGVLLTKTKDPFLDQGLSMKLKGGVNDFTLQGRNFFSANGNGMYNFSSRFAKSFWDKLAIKMTATLKGGTDWKAQNYDNIGAGSKEARRSDQVLSVDAAMHPGYNGVNLYGDEDFVYLPVGSEKLDTAPGALVPVARTGYKEKALVDYDITTRKFSGALHYKFAPEYRLIAGGRYGFTNALYTGDSRVRLDGFKIYQGKLNLQLKDFSLLGYSTWQNSGQSYDVSRLADNLLDAAKSDENWYRDYRIAFDKGIRYMGISPGSYEDARKFADSGATLIDNGTAVPRFEPGTDRFHEKVDELKTRTDFNEGAAIRDHSKLYHLQSSYQLNELISNGGIKFGGDFRYYNIDSNGTVFPDTASNDISNYQFGGFISMNNHLYDEKLNVRSAFRIDKNENFGFQWSPTIALNYSPDQKNYYRLSYQKGFRYPGLREQFINKNLGKARLIGGLPEVVHQYNLPKNSFVTAAVDKFNQAVIDDINKTPDSPREYSRAQAELNNLSLLQDGILREGAFNNIETEIANTFEVGYKRLFSKKLFLDLNYYVSFYKNFLGITRVIKPRTSPRTDLFTAAGQINNSLESDKYYVYSNARGRLTVHGISFNLEYLSGGFLMGLNGTWTTLTKNSDDPITPGFNTPPFKLNFEWGHRKITDHFGFKMVYRFRSKYEWESPFVDGTIEGYGHFDFQFNLDIPSAAGNLKFGVTNWGIQRYYNIYGGPSIGSILFASYTFDPNIF